MSEQRKVRVGISGLGSFSFVVANTVKRSQRVELVTCFDPVADKRAATSQRYGCEQEDSYEALVKRKDLDGVLIVSPNAYHREQTELAAQHGKHVYVEKPIANTIEDGCRMIEACDRAGVKLLIGHVHRRHATNRKTKEMVEQGLLGKLAMVEANFSSQQGWELRPDEFRWTADEAGCPGGSLMTMGVHQADTFNYIFGPVKSVFSYFNRLHIHAPIDDVTVTVLQFESGILGYLGTNFITPRTHWIWVYGTEANLLKTLSRLDRKFDAERKQNPDEGSRLELFRKGSTGPELVPFAIGDPMLEQIDEFADCVQTGRQPETDGRSSIKALSVILASIRAAKTGKPVDVEKVAV